jgi:hypothetical protein
MSSARDHGRVPCGAKTGQAIDRYQRIRGVHPVAGSPRLLLGLRAAMTVDGVREVLEVRSVCVAMISEWPDRPRRRSC